MTPTVNSSEILVIKNQRPHLVAIPCRRFTGMALETDQTCHALWQWRGFFKRAFRRFIKRMNQLFGNKPSLYKSADDQKSLVLSDQLSGKRNHLQNAGAETLFKVNSSVQGPMHLLSKYLRRWRRSRSVVVTSGTAGDGFEMFMHFPQFWQKKNSFITRIMSWYITIELYIGVDFISLSKTLSWPLLL